VNVRRIFNFFIFDLWLNQQIVKFNSEDIINSRLCSFPAYCGDVREAAVKPPPEASNTTANF